MRTVIGNIVDCADVVFSHLSPIKRIDIPMNSKAK